jgi:hypothetical protein
MSTWSTLRLMREEVKEAEVDAPPQSADTDLLSELWHSRLRLGSSFRQSQSEPTRRERRGRSGTFEIRELERADGDEADGPTRGKDLILRTAKQGVHAGSGFYGCSSFPACRGTRPPPVDWCLTT